MLVLFKDITGLGLIILSAFFFSAGTFGLLRFPDLYTRIHAPTKADNLGLGLLILAFAIQADSVFTFFKLLIIWPLAQIASSASAQLIMSYKYETQKEKETRTNKD